MDKSFCGGGGGGGGIDASLNIVLTTQLARDEEEEEEEREGVKSWEFWARLKGRKDRLGANLPLPW